MRCVPNGVMKRVLKVLAVGVSLLAVVSLIGCGPSEPAEEPSTNGGLESTPTNETDQGGGSSVEESVPSEPKPVDGATHTVKQVLDAPVEGDRVVLGGEIVEMLTSQDFMLDDGTGKVFVDGDDDFGSLSVGDRLLVTGDVDVEDSPTRVEIQATAVERN